MANQLSAGMDASPVELEYVKANCADEKLGMSMLPTISTFPRNNWPVFGEEMESSAVWANKTRSREKRVGNMAIDKFNMKGWQGQIGNKIN